MPGYRAVRGRGQRRAWQRRHKQRTGEDARRCLGFAPNADVVGGVCGGGGMCARVGTRSIGGGPVALPGYRAVRGRRRRRAWQRRHGQRTGEAARRCLGLAPNADVVSGACGGGGMCARVETRSNARRCAALPGFRAER